MLGFSVAIIRPQKRYIHYLLDCFILMILSLKMFLIIAFLLTRTCLISKKFEQLFQDVVVSLPIIYIVGLVTYWIVVKKRVPQNVGDFVMRGTRRLVFGYSSEQTNLLRDVSS